MWIYSVRLSQARQFLQALLHFAYPVGFCASCQRQTEWRDAGTAFVCRFCGADPLLEATH